MNGLSGFLEAIIKKNHINKVLYADGVWYGIEDAEKLIKQQIDVFLSKLSKNQTFSVYGGGRYFDYIFDAFGEIQDRILCIIDNNLRIPEKYGFPVASYLEWQLSEKSDVVIITAWDYHREIYDDLKKSEYSGNIIDLPFWILERFPMFYRPLYEQIWRNGGEKYRYISFLETRYRESEGLTAYILLKNLIYRLFEIKDFLYAEKYIEEMDAYFSAYGEVKRYRNAIFEVKKMLETCASKAGKDVLFINVIDSLSDSFVEEMPYLKRFSEKGVRFRGVTTQYPFTRYALNAIFTGKSPFEIERTTDKVSWSDSSFLRYVRQNDYTLHLVSGKESVLNAFEEINENKELLEADYTFTEVLFEGFVLWEKKKQKNIIVLHSLLEIHAPHYRVGASQELSLYQLKERASIEENEALLKEAISYVDEELKWYNPFYEITNMPIVIMGDHGWSAEFQFNCYNNLH